MSERPPTAVADEARVLRTVRDNLLRLVAGPAYADHEARLVELRDRLADERLADDIASLVEEMDRTAALMAQQRRSAAQGLVDPDSPYFGRMVLDDDFGERAILIGKSTFLSDRIRIVDWRNAPISRIFYQYAEGDDYDEEINGQLVSGEVRLRRTMTIVDGELRRVSTDEHTWVRVADGRWEDLRAAEVQLAGGAGVAIRPDMLGTRHSSGRRDKHLPDIASLLDPEQFALITRPDAGVVVIQGSAGSGKTTVGLHRIAYLAFKDRGRFRGDRVMVVVFSRALAAYIGQVLPALGVDDVPVVTYPGWAREQRRRHFRGLPKVYSDETPALVSRFKTHTALLRMIDDLARGRRPEGGPLECFEELFTDRSWLEAGLARYAPGAFSDAEIERIHRWGVMQNCFRVEGGGMAEHAIPTLDAEDDPILLRLHQVVRGPLERRPGRALRYAHVMVDEAQDLSALELAVLIGATDDARSVTIAGDAAQAVMTEREFTSWTDVLDALDLSHVRVSPLQVSYRSTRQIMTCAREILGPLAPDEPVAAPREGAPVAHLRFQSMGAAVAWLAEALTDLCAREPVASVALLTPDLSRAVEWFQVFERAEVPHLKLVADQDFSFAPGVEVTDVRSAKGLEFDYVVVLDVDADRYPDQPSARHLLHVAATRAAHQLWLVSAGTPSPLVPEGLAGRLL